MNSSSSVQAVSGSRLVALLSDWAFVEAEASRQDWAERLSQWLDAFDAITLDAAHQSIRAGGREVRRGAAAPRASAVAADFGRVRAELADAIAAKDAPDGERSGDRLPELAAGDESDAGFAPYRARCLALQARMEKRIEALRGRVRQALERASPALRQLAALDAALDQTLGAPLRKVLAKLPWLLERRFEQLRKTRLEALAAAGGADDPAAWRAPGGWLDTFEREFQQALQAELDLRLEPVAGLIEALGSPLPGAFDGNFAGRSGSHSGSASGEHR